MDKKPSIRTIKNGPFRLAGLDEITDAFGRIISIDSTVNLCRCGASDSKPFCDGSHVTSGFRDDLSTTRRVKTRAHKGKVITIHFNSVFCSHPGYCLRQSPDVFHLGRDHWIDPDADTVENIIRAIKMCPTGALSYTLDGIHHDLFSDAPGLKVMKDGPYNVKGSVELLDPRRPESTEHYSLCRCGRSKNKPFCDGMHRQQ